MPPKKKKGGKKGKLAKMTEEERKIFLEKQRLAEEEMKRQKEEMLSQFLQKKLEKEEQMTRMNLNKINDQWRDIMRDMKCVELRKELEILHQTFERIVDRKNSVLRSLGKDIMEAEEQYSMAVRSHLQNIDKLIDIQDKRVERLCAEFHKERDDLVTEFDEERKELEEKHERDRLELQDVIHAMEQNFLEQESEAKHEFQITRDEIKSKNLEDKHTLRVQLEGQVEDLWSQFTAALNAYQEATEERRVMYEQLKAKDEKSAKIIEQQMRKLQKISEQTALLKSQMAYGAKEADERNLRIKEDKEIMILHYNDLKHQMQKIRNNQQGHLISLTVTSTDTIKQLQAKLTKAERVLKFAEMCRRFESEEEKVIPFYQGSLTPEEQKDCMDAIKVLPTEKLTLSMFKYMSLENFWKRYNKVLLDKVALEKERETISQQNLRLRELLKQYLDGISVNDHVINTQDKGLIKVSDAGHTKLNVPVGDSRVKHQTGKPVVIEAAHIAKTIVLT